MSDANQGNNSAEVGPSTPLNDILNFALFEAIHLLDSAKANLTRVYEKVLSESNENANLPKILNEALVSISKIIGILFTLVIDKHLPLSIANAKLQGILKQVLAWISKVIALLRSAEEPVRNLQTTLNEIAMGNLQNDVYEVMNLLVSAKGILYSLLV